MSKLSAKASRRNTIRRRIRGRVKGTAERPRLCVFRSNTDIYAQIIDDTKGITLASCSSKHKDIAANAGNKVEKSKMVGLQLAAVAKSKGIEKVTFDRGGYLYHGRVQALADGAREGGLIF